MKTGLFVTGMLGITALGACTPVQQQQPSPAAQQLASQLPPGRVFAFGTTEKSRLSSVLSGRRCASARLRSVRLRPAFGNFQFGECREEACRRPALFVGAF
jgi:hypothetical protein